MSKREAFFDAACKEQVDDFLSFIQLHTDSADPFDVEEVLQEFPQDQRGALWDRVASLLQDVLLEMPPDHWEVEPGQGGTQEEGMEVAVSVDPKCAKAVVEGVTLVASVSLNVLQDGDAYSGLLRCANKLHDVLTALPVSEEPLQLSLHKLYEAWWKKGLQDREKFGRTALHICLQRTLNLKKTKAEIQRLWSLHDVLLTLDITSQDNKPIIDLLLQCFLSVNCIKHDDGKRFLVFLFSWNVNFIWMIHGTVKNQLEFINKTLVTHLAEIYFRAWKKATGVFLEKIETTCIQDFMQHAILLHRTSPVHAKVRQIVSYFHKRKGCHRVDKMLYTLYTPILWSALSAPNFEVRANAALLFTEAFAVHDPSQKSEAIDQTIQKQLDTLMDLLEDPHPLVRSTATLGVCKILATCWELLPPTVITDFLKKLVGELAADTSSPDVRSAVFKCLNIVLDNAHSHQLLEKLLPTLKYSLHDTSEKVRTAFLDMLIKVKAVRAAKFWDVCNMDHLLARLAVDSQPVSKRIVSLLFKSFLPVNESEKEWCCRCITLIQMNPGAARRFYQHAYIHTAPTNIVKLMLAIRRILNSCLKNNTDNSELDDSNKENSAVENMLSVTDTAIVASLLEVVVILWRSVEKALRHNREAQQYTVAKFSSVMSKYFNTFHDERCTVPLILLASFMPPAAVPTFSCGVLSRLRKAEPAAVQSQYSQLIGCMCGWGQAGDILNLISDWLSEALPKKADIAPTGRKVRIQETVEAKPDLALVYLDYLLSHFSTRDSTLSLSQGPLKHIHNILGNWRSVLYTHLTSETEPIGPSVQTALNAFTFHSRLSAHLQHNASEGREYLQSVEHTAGWVTEKVLPFLATHGEGDGPSEKQLALARQIVESILTACRDILLVGLVDQRFKGQVLHTCSLILLSEMGYLCIPLLLSVLKELMETCEPGPVEAQAAGGDQEQTSMVMMSVVANFFQKVVELLACRLRKDPEEGKQLCQASVPGLTEFLQVVQTWEDVPSNPLSGVFSTLFAGIIVENRHVLQKISHSEELISPDSVEDLPPLSSILLSVILKSPSFTRGFLTEINSSLNSGAIDCLTGLTAVLHILAVINGSRFKLDLKSAAISVQTRLQTHAVTFAEKEDVQRVIYESSVKNLNVILDL